MTARSGSSRNSVYLDHAATTPMVPEAIEAMTARLAVIGNPSSLHAAGRAARRVVDDFDFSANHGRPLRIGHLSGDGAGGGCLCHRAQ